MAEQYGFFDGDTLYGQEEFNRYFDYMFESGVGADNGVLELEVTKTANGLSVAKGYACVKGFYYYNSASKELSVTPNATYPRIDRVVVRANLVTGPVSVLLKAGTPGSNPVAPTLQRDDSVYEISLARVHVATNGALTVYDERSDETVCGAMRPKNFSGYTEMVTEYQKRWEEWFKAQQGTAQRNIFVQASEPDEAVSGTIWIEEIE